MFKGDATRLCALSAKFDAQNGVLRCSRSLEGDTATHFSQQGEM